MNVTAAPWSQWQLVLAADARFARMVTGAWKYRMADEVWTGVRAIQARVPDQWRVGQQP